MLLCNQISSVENIRDFNEVDYEEKRIKPNMLIRSAGLTNLSEKDRDYLLNWHLSTIIDFRDFSEREKNSDVEIKGCDNIFLPVLENMQMSVLNTNKLAKTFPNVSKIVEIVMNQSERMKTFYKQFVSDERAIKSYKRFFSVLLENGKEGKCTLFHCTAGKDRTGYASALFLSALGFSWDSIMQDYLLSNVYMSERIENSAKKFAKLGIDQKTIDIAKKKFFANEDYLNSAFELINNEYNGIHEYLKNVLNLTEDDLSNLKTYYLQ